MLAIVEWPMLLLCMVCCRVLPWPLLSSNTRSDRHFAEHPPTKWSSQLVEPHVPPSESALHAASLVLLQAHDTNSP